MADSALTAEYRCSYCYLEFNSMIDPRELPCHHVFCITCLQGDYTDNSNICCRICQRVYNMDTLDHLPTVSLDTEVEDDTNSSLTCNCHNCDGQVAVCYCVECDVKMCDTHQQTHKTFLGDRHEVISLSTYKMSPGTYKRVWCKQHGGEQVVEICESCNVSKCLRCGRAEPNCTDDSPNHFLKPLTVLKEEITAHFNQLLQSASDKLTEICKLDKYIWKVLDVEEIECKKRIEMIERIRDEQIEAVREESNKLKEQIYKHQKRLTQQVELYNTQLIDKKEKIEETRTKVHRWLRESHVAEKVQQKQQMTDELRESTDIEFDCQPTRATLVTYPCNNVSPNAKLVDIPTSITLTSEQPTNSECYSASYREDGDLVLGCRDGMRFLRQNMQMIEYNADIYNFSTAVSHRREVFALQWSTTQSTVMAFDAGIKQMEKLFTLDYAHDTSGSFATVNDSYIVATNPTQHTLVLYDFLTKQTSALHIPVAPRRILFLPDGDLLVTSSQPAAGLVGYKIQNAELCEVWAYKGMGKVGSVCTDADGLIYACSNQTLHIISTDGVKLREVTHDKIPGSSVQISIKGRDELAVPSWDGKSVCLFKITT